MTTIPLVIATMVMSGLVSGQSRPAPPAGNATPGGPTTGIAKGVAYSADYVIGPDDVLTVVVWKETEVSGDVTVRPDGKISLPLMNDVQAAGLTPDQLRVRITEAARKFLTDPTVTVVVKTINSRKVFVTGQVSKPGHYPLSNTTTVLQLLAMAGGLLEWADASKISIVRGTTSFQFNYKDVSRGRNLEQNITLQPGDTVVVP